VEVQVLSIAFLKKEGRIEFNASLFLIQLGFRESTFEDAGWQNRLPVPLP
jgi:hypothetical protein